MYGSSSVLDKRTCLSSSIILHIHQCGSPESRFNCSNTMAGAVWNEDDYELTADSFAAPVSTILVVYMEWRLLIFLNLNINHTNSDMMQTKFFILHPFCNWWSSSWILLLLDCRFICTPRLILSNYSSFIYVWTYNNVDFSWWLELKDFGRFYCSISYTIWLCSYQVPVTHACTEHHMCIVQYHLFVFPLKQKCVLYRWWHYAYCRQM